MRRTLPFFAALTLWGGLASADWLTEIDARVEPLWAGSFLPDCARYLKPDHPLNDAQLKATVRVVVRRDGALLKVSVASPSGQKDLDRAAAEVIVDSAPWPEPPESALSDDGHAHVDWPLFRDPEADGAAAARLVRVRWPLERVVPALIEQQRWQVALDRLAGPDEAPDGVRTALTDQVISAWLTAQLDAVPEATIAARAGQDEGLSAALRARAKAGRPAAVTALAARRDDRAHALLGDLLLGDDVAVARTAGRGLARLNRRTQAWARLAPLVAERDSRLDALRAAAELGATESVPALLAAVAKGEPLAVRCAAAEALGAAADGRLGPATSALRRLLTADEPSLRVAALRGLARAGRDGARSKGLFYRVIPLLKDQPPQVRAAALVAMAATGGQRAETDLLLLSRKARHPAVREAAVRALALLPGEAVTSRLARMRSQGPRAQQAAAWRALAERGVVDPWPTDLDYETTLLLRGARLRQLRQAKGSKAAVARLARELAAAKTPALRASWAGAWLWATARRGEAHARR